MVNGPAMGSMGWLACSVIQSRAHFTVSGWDPAAVTHRDGELRVESPNFEEGSSEAPGQSLETKRELSVLVKLWERWYDSVRGNLSSLSLERDGPSHCVMLTYKDSSAMTISSNHSSTILIITTEQNIKQHWYIHRYVFTCFGARMKVYGTEEWATSGCGCPHNTVLAAGYTWWWVRLHHRLPVGCSWRCSRCRWPCPTTCCAHYTHSSILIFVRLGWGKVATLAIWPVFLYSQFIPHQQSFFFSTVFCRCWSHGGGAAEQHTW